MDQPKQQSPSVTTVPSVSSVVSVPAVVVVDRQKEQIQIERDEEREVLRRENARIA